LEVSFDFHPTRLFPRSGETNSPESRSKLPHSKGMVDELVDVRRREVEARQEAGPKRRQEATAFKSLWVCGGRRFSGTGDWGLVA
jgi:hypothetical protein